MKPITYFSLCLLTGLCLLSFSAKANHGKIVKSNWPSQYMGEMGTPCLLPPSTLRPCIEKDNNGRIQIGLSYEISKDYDNTPIPPIYLRYTVANQVGIVAQSAMTEVSSSLNNYRKFKITVTINLNQVDDGFHYLFEVVMQRPNGTYRPYPVDHYPDLFKEDIYPIVLNNWNNYKEICQREVSLPTDDPCPNDPTFNICDRNPSLPGCRGLRNIDFTVKAYPNPFTNQFYITNDTEENGTIEIFNIQGKLIYREENITFVKDSPKKIDTSNFLAGMYYCKIKTTTGSKTIQLVKN